MVVLRWIAVCFALGVAAAQTPRIAIVGGPEALWPRIVETWQARHPELRVEWQIGAPAERQTFDLFFAYYPTPEQIAQFERIEARRNLALPAEFIEPRWRRRVDEEGAKPAAAYLDQGGIENGVRLLSYLYGQVKAGGPAVLPPLPGVRSGIYHPAAAEVFADREAYVAWWRQRPGAVPDAPVVAVTFFSTLMRGNDLAAVDAFVAALEARGFLPLAAFGYPLGQLTKYLTPAPDVIIALNTTLYSPQDNKVYEALGAPVLNGVVLRETRSAWEASPTGIAPDRLTAHLSVPEKVGLVRPVLAATSETTAAGYKATIPYGPGVERLVGTAERFVQLRRKANADKRVALLYYNNPAGKGNIGASYLQVFPSIENILRGLERAGYNTGEAVPDRREWQRLLETAGRNVELWAPGEKRALAAQPSTVRWPLEEYLRHYRELPREFRNQVEEVWGPPSRRQLMTEACGGTLCFLLPAWRAGNLLVAPQPLRTSIERLARPEHDPVTPPPHQYVAFYLWLRKVWGADAVIHLGRHGTLEWLPGKQAALAPGDAPEVLLGDLPNFYIYVMDGGGEAIQAKRRGGATLISHLTPMIVRTGARADIEPLHEAFHQLTADGQALTEEIRAELHRTVRRELKRLDLERQLGLKAEAGWEEIVPVLHRFLHEVEAAPLPDGLPVFGQTPGEEQLRGAVEAYLFALYPLERHPDIEQEVGSWAARLLAGEKLPEGQPEWERANREIPGWLSQLREAGPTEMAGLLRGLAGQHVPSQVLGDPLRRPDALPTGRNLHALDPARLPTREAWAVGQRMAAEYLEKHKQEKGAFPRKVAVVLWYGETERNQGALEGMALALLGVEPVWNQRGLVEDLRLIPLEELGRPRVDVVFNVSGNYRDGFADKLNLLDRAIQLAGLPNAETKAALMKQGLPAEEAERLARLRIFAPKPGAYGVGVQALLEQSGGADTPEKIAALYSANMSYGYGEGQWGTPAAAALTAQLRQVESIQFSRSSNLYGALDNDDTYQFVGGLRTAVAQAAGQAPEIYLHNLRQWDARRMTTLREWLATELHSRQFNPRWIEGMKAAGYAGAREMVREVEHLYGFQKTTPEQLSPATWQMVYDTYISDKGKLGLREFFARENPHARQTLLARLVEVDRQGIYRFAPAVRAALMKEYAESVVKSGVACNAQVCANRKLQEHLVSGLGAAAVTEGYRQRVAEATGRPAPVAAPAPAPVKLSRWEELKKSSLVWVRTVRVRWSATGIPWWVWVSLGSAYLLAIAWRARRLPERPAGLFRA